MRVPGQPIGSICHATVRRLVFGGVPRCSVITSRLRSSSSTKVRPPPPRMLPVTSIRRGFAPTSIRTHCLYEGDAHLEDVLDELIGQHDDDRALPWQASCPRHVPDVLTEMPHGAARTGSNSPSPYPPWNVVISVSEVWETISPAQNARHHRASDGESDARAAAAPLEVAAAMDGRYPPPSRDGRSTRRTAWPWARSGPRPVDR